MLMIGAPDAGKSMLAARLPSILPPLSPPELLEVSMIASVAGEIEGGALTSRRPFRSARARFAAPAARERRGLGVPCQSRRDLSGALHAGGGDEPVPLRPCLRAGLCVQTRPDRPLHLGLSDAHLRAADGPYRPAHRGAGGHRRRPDPAAAR